MPNSVMDMAVKEGVRITAHRTLDIVNAAMSHNRMALTEALLLRLWQTHLETEMLTIIQALEATGLLEKLHKDAQKQRKLAGITEVKVAWRDRMQALGIKVNWKVWEKVWDDTSIFPHHFNALGSMNVLVGGIQGGTIGILNGGLATSWTLRPNLETVGMMSDLGRLRAYDVDYGVRTKIDQILYERFYVNGDGPDDLKRELLAQIPDISRRTATTVAHMDSMLYEMMSVKAQMKAVGVKYVRWMAHNIKTSTDPRASHRLADGQLVGIDEKFIVGDGFLEYPGDPSGPPKEIYNCHCTIVPVIDERIQGRYQGMMDETFEDLGVGGRPTDPGLKRARYNPNSYVLQKVLEEEARKALEREKALAAAKVRDAAAKAAISPPTRPYGASIPDISSAVSGFELDSAPGGGISHTLHGETTDGRKWYFKTPGNSGGIHEVWSEVVAARIGPQMGVELPEVYGVIKGPFSKTTQESVAKYYLAQHPPIVTTVERVAKNQHWVLVENWETRLLGQGYADMYSPTSSSSMWGGRGIEIAGNVKGVLFDYVTCNEDRHGYNFAYQKVGGVNKLVLWDQGLSLGAWDHSPGIESSLSGYMSRYGRSLSRDTRDLMRTLSSVDKKKARQAIKEVQADIRANRAGIISAVADPTNSVYLPKGYVGSQDWEVELVTKRLDYITRHSADDIFSELGGLNTHDR